MRKRDTRRYQITVNIYHVCVCTYIYVRERERGREGRREREDEIEMHEEREVTSMRKYPEWSD